MTPAEVDDRRPAGRVVRKHGGVTHEEQPLRLTHELHAVHRHTAPTQQRSRGDFGASVAHQKLQRHEGLQYNLFTSVAATTIWGDGTNSTGTVPGTGAGMAAASTQTHTVFGQLPDNAFNQGAPTGTYNDSITVTVTY